MWVRHASLVVVFDDFHESLLAAIMHVRCGESHVAYRGRLECTGFRDILAHRHPTVIGSLNVDSDVVEQFIGKVHASVTRRTVRFAKEQVASTSSRFADGMSRGSSERRLGFCG